MNKISIIIPVHNRKACVQNILNQIYNQVTKAIHLAEIFVIVIDDGSTDGTKELIKNNFTFVHLLEGDGSLWWTGAIVKGMEYALKILDTDYVVWLNDDVSIAEEFVNNLVSISVADEDKKTIVGGIVRDKTYSDWIVYSGMKDGQPIHNINLFSLSKELEVVALNGNIVVIPRYVIDKVGLPDAIKFPQIGADFEFIKRANKLGFRVVSSSLLQGSTDYTVTDVIRYMPYWMQWYVQPNKARKYDVVKGLRTMKATQNIHFFVNIINPNSNNISKWRYELCYLNKLLKIFIVNFLPKTSIESRISNYLEHRGTPSEVIDAVMPQRNSR